MAANLNNIETSSSSSPLLTRKRKISITSQQTQFDPTPTNTRCSTHDYTKHLDEMKNQYIKASSVRQSTTGTLISAKNQLESRLKVIEFLKDHIYPTDAAILSFQMKNADLFPKKRLLNQRIREIRQKLMSNVQQRSLT